MKKYIEQFKDKARSLPRDFWLFLLATVFIGFASSIVESTFNNFLNEQYAITSLQRTVIELPRELPGVMVVFISALLFFFCNRTLAAVSQVLAAIGILLIALTAKSFSVMLAWLFIFSLGQHIFLPLTSDIGMELARDGKTGRRLGQLQGAGNFAAIAGSFFIFLGFKYLRLNFPTAFIISAVFLLLAAGLIFGMKKNMPVPFKTKLVYRKEYYLYYILTVMFGTRKQLFMTFAPWVLITVYMQPTQAIATLLTIGGIIGIVFKPLLGRWIDKYGERVILSIETVMTVFVCVFYGFAGKMFSHGVALAIISGCYIIDQLLMSVSMARATYLKKVALSPQDVTATLSAGTSIDHVFSISVALLGGIVWTRFGYEYIFLSGAVLALVNLVFTLKIRT
ncbi:MAG: MFS transporter [Elusimicrobiota bacterium]